MARDVSLTVSAFGGKGEHKDEETRNTSPDVNAVAAIFLEANVPIVRIVKPGAVSLGVRLLALPQMDVASVTGDHGDLDIGVTSSCYLTLQGRNGGACQTVFLGTPYDLNNRNDRATIRLASANLEPGESSQQYPTSLSYSPTSRSGRSSCGRDLRVPLMASTFSIYAISRPSSPLSGPV